MRVSTGLLLLVVSCGGAPHAQPVDNPAARGDQGWFEVDEAFETPATVELQPSEPRKHSKPCFPLADDGDNFLGNARGETKTTAASARPTKTTMSALLARLHSGPLADDQMRTQGLHEACDFARTREEQQNVIVDGWVLAATKESDNDFHMIVSAENRADSDATQLINVEVSGLPPDGTPGRAALVRARKQFRALFVPAVKDKVSKKYTTMTPFHVRITGSLFFDVDHAGGIVGPGALKPVSSWEIHPVTNLEAL